MPTRTQLDAIITKIQGSRDLSPGGIAALKELAYALNAAIAETATEVAALQAGPYILHTADASLTEAQTAVGVGVTITLDMPAGFVEFKV